LPAVKTADQATDVALSFLKKSGWSFARALSAHEKNGSWVVQVDVGALTFQAGTLKVNARTGAIIEYDIPKPFAV
jgi:uncharacterized membrane protein YkoI